MNEVAPTPDRDLVRSYAREGSESAFRSLVARHVNLVFATAYRQVGDAGLAEEITQNVFVTLARKAPRLAGHETIAGWLHRTAILEAKARFRSEMRRRRREEVAAAIAEAQMPGRDPVEDLSPLLDEALLQLREPDRVALVLRFLEERSLREVGTVLGVDEDAARKRVHRALERVTDFFRRRGFALPGAGGVTLLGQTAKAAPAGLAAAASAAGLGAGSPASGLSLLLIQFMSLTKIQTAAVCALLAFAPAAWHSLALGSTRRETTELRRTLDDLQARATAADAESDRLQSALLAARTETANARVKALQLEGARPPRNAPQSVAAYRWDDKAPVVRVPKEMLGKVGITAVANQQGQLTAEIRNALQLTEVETDKVQAAIDRLAANYHRLAANLVRPVEPTTEDLQGLTPDKVRVFDIQGLHEPAKALRDEFLADLGSILAPDRQQLLLAALESWMGAADEQYGIRSSQALYFQDHRVRLAHPGEEALTGPEPRISYGVSLPNRGSFFGNAPLADLPEWLRPQVQPWLDAARAHAAAAAPATAPQTPPPTHSTQP